MLQTLISDQCDRNRRLVLLGAARSARHLLQLCVVDAEVNNNEAGVDPAWTRLGPGVNPAWPRRDVELQQSGIEAAGKKLK
ncbi:uncharacterized protein V6R79_009694 [Siganus canaliculatus]